ncbi:MAG: CocE/NonD family hydrolase, partial [Gemmataceae bacterium]
MTCLLLVLFSVAPPVRSATEVGDRLLAESFRQRALALREKALAEVRDATEWTKRQLQRRREFLAMMGLDPLPKRTPLQATITGTLDTPHYRVENLHFQSLPGLYVTANLYRPLKVEKPLPAILYLCGHGAQIHDGISYGNKVTYQHHGAWFAENGYVCLIVDTLQLGELQGLHHGTYRLGLWWWQSLGYTPAGIELWNALRAVDYLETRPEVDRTRIGVTGRSGGGATSWWAMAADERLRCAVPVAGLADLLAHVSEGSPGRLERGVVGGHCDCMYFVNTQRWDFVQVMALCAPRPVLLGNSDADP